MGQALDGLSKEHSYKNTHKKKYSAAQMLILVQVYFGKISYFFLTSGAAVLQSVQPLMALHFQDHGQRLCQLTPISRRDYGVPFAPFRSLWFGSSAFRPVTKDSRQ